MWHLNSSGLLPETMARERLTGGSRHVLVKNPGQKPKQRRRREKSHNSFFFSMVVQVADEMYGSLIGRVERTDVPRLWPFRIVWFCWPATKDGEIATRTRLWSVASTAQRYGKPPPASKQQQSSSDWNQGKQQRNYTHNYSSGRPGPTKLYIPLVS